MWLNVPPSVGSSVCQSCTCKIVLLAHMIYTVKTLSFFFTSFLFVFISSFVTLNRIIVRGVRFALLTSAIKPIFSRKDSQSMKNWKLSFSLTVSTANGVNVTPEIHIFGLQYQARAGCSSGARMLEPSIHSRFPIFVFSSFKMIFPPKIIFDLHWRWFKEEDSWKTASQKRRENHFKWQRKLVDVERPKAEGACPFLYEYDRFLTDHRREDRRMDRPTDGRTNGQTKWLMKSLSSRLKIGAGEGHRRVETSSMVQRGVGRKLARS